jgi:hypothetical protein
MGAFVMLELPQQTVEVVSTAAGTLSSTQAGALIVLLLVTNITSVWAMLRCYRRGAHPRSRSRGDV